MANTQRLYKVRIFFPITILETNEEGIIDIVDYDLDTDYHDIDVDYPFIEPKIGVEKKKEKNQCFFSKSLKGTLLIRQQDDTDLYNKLLQWFKGERKCDDILINIDWWCEGEYNPFFKGRFNLLNDAKLMLGKNCQWEIKIKENGISQCKKDTKNDEVNFYGVNFFSITAGKIKGTNGEFLNVKYRKNCSNVKILKVVNNYIDSVIYDEYSNTILDMPSNLAVDTSISVANPLEQTSIFDVILPPSIDFVPKPNCNANPNMDLFTASRFDFGGHDTPPPYLELDEIIPVNVRSCHNGVDVINDGFDIVNGASYGSDNSRGLIKYENTCPENWWYLGTVLVNTEDEELEQNNDDTLSDLFVTINSFWHREYINAAEGAPINDYGEWYYYAPQNRYYRCPKQRRKNTTTNTIINGRLLNGVIEYFLLNHKCKTKQKLWDKVVSIFFNINPPSSPIYNFILPPYQYAIDFLQSITIHQKSDVKFTKASQQAQEKVFFWTWEHFDDIMNMFNLCWWIETNSDTGEKIFRIEHKSLIELLRNEDPIDFAKDYPKIISNTKQSYSVSNNNLPQRERFEWMDDEVSDYFMGEDIIYDDDCAKPDNDKSIKIKNFTTDFRAVQFNDDVFDSDTSLETGFSIDDAGFVLIANHFNQSPLGYYVIDENRPLSFTELHEHLFKWDRYLSNGKINNKIVEGGFFSTRPIFKSNKYKIPYLCSKEPDFLDTIDVKHPLANYNLHLGLVNGVYQTERESGIGILDKCLAYRDNTGCWLEFDITWQCINQANEACDFSNIDVAFNMIKLCPGDTFNGTIIQEGVAAYLNITISNLDTYDIITQIEINELTYTSTGYDLTNIDIPYLFNYNFSFLNVGISINRLGCETKLHEVTVIASFDKGEIIEENEYETIYLSQIENFLSSTLDQHSLTDCFTTIDCTLDHININFSLNKFCPGDTTLTGNTIQQGVAANYHVNITGLNAGDIVTQFELSYSGSSYSNYPDTNTNNYTDFDIFNPIELINQIVDTKITIIKDGCSPQVVECHFYVEVVQGSNTIGTEWDSINLFTTKNGSAQLIDSHMISDC